MRRAQEFGTTAMHFPGHHIMSRWKSNTKHLTYLGTLDEVVDFRYLPTSVQTSAFAQLIGAIGTDQAVDAANEACGSPGEVANEPWRGHRYHIHLTEEFGNDFSDVGLHTTYPNVAGKSMVHNNAVLTADDQLRQRMAWALYQIYHGQGGASTREIESYQGFYDIFVRHAFGNLKDVLREISYAPQMGKYLTYNQNKKFAYKGTYPDENYAREIMQLFSVGLYSLHQDGTTQNDVEGVALPVYDNDDIVSVARAWTGFDNQPSRGNYAHYTGDSSTNNIDPMKINPAWRDMLPKMDLYDNYLADQIPPCSELPSRRFLRTGARYSYLGQSSVPRLQRDAGVFTLDVASPLYGQLCAEDGGICQFPQEVVLAENLACATGTFECEVDTVRVLQVRLVLGDLFAPIAPN
jgi:cullin-associated NEDD8-dissociated protein 1